MTLSSLADGAHVVALVTFTVLALAMSVPIIYYLYTTNILI